MAGERDDKGIPPPGLEAQQTIRAEALPSLGARADDPDALIDLHRRTAARLVKEGAPGRAFAELVKASRAIPMTRRLAAALVAISGRAGTEPAAMTLLASGVEENEGQVRIDIRRQLARLLRKAGDLERAREALVLILAEKPGDRRARRVLNALLEREERWEELDASLEKEMREAVKRGALRRGARASLSRGRLWGERLGNHAHAALRYGQAAELLEQARDFEAAFNLRLLWVRSLRESQAPQGALNDAVARCIESGERVGKELRARSLLREMGVLPGTAQVSPIPSSGDGGKKVGRRHTQRELLAAAEEADAHGKKPEAAALFQAAVAEAPEPETLERLEAHYVARGAWRELANFYRDRAAQAKDPAAQAELLTRMAELLEDELGEPAAAARAYGEIVQLTGDDRALREQVRLLSERQDHTGVQRALDQAVQSAATDEARAAALVARGEAALARRELGKARRDFELALQSTPSHLAALCGLAESVAERGEREPALALKSALAAMPRRQEGRAEYLRRLARLGDGPLKDLELSRWAWNEVLGESPLDAGAQRRLAAIARKTGESQALLELLVAQLDREPRGLQAREAWRERVAVLEKLGRGEEAVEVLRQAVRFEPGHKEAWLLLADRLAQRGKNGEAAWAYEHGATTTEDESERQQAWVRLARFARDVLKDPAKAQVYAARAENLRQAIEEAALLASAPLVPLAPRTPPKGVGNQPTGSTGQLTEAERRAAEEDRRVGSSEVATDPGQRMDDEELDDDSEDGALLQGVLIEEETELGHQRPPATEELEPSEIVTGKAPVFPGRRTEQIQRPQLPDPESPQEERAPQPGDFDEDEDEPEPTWGGAYPSQAQEDLFQAVHERPLDPEGYLALADYFEDLGDAERGGLMAEIATALEGDPAAAPRAPKLMLSAPDRSSLRHPFLRGPEGELLSLVGVALCRLFAPEGSPSGDEFRIDSGRGAGAAAEALQAAVRILGVRAPEVFISPDIGPPFSLTFVRTPRLLVGRAAVDRQLPEAELRFFAGRALFAQNPDLLALRQLTLEQLEEGLGYLDLVLRDSKDRKAKVRALRELLPKKGLDVVRQLHGEIRDEMDLALMSEGARHSANRAGLVVCGGVAPAITALRAKRAPEEELMELVRFAASERYLKLRQRRLG